LIAGAGALSIMVSGAAAQVSAKRVLSWGEVTGNDVYVRSGPSANHYPVCKLNAGHRIAIVGDSGEWFEINPPEEIFSFISGDYVDTPDDRFGVVNGNNVRVRAASVLPEFSKLKYVVQTKLPKGAEVTILGRDPDGFLRIKPPAGTSVWVNRAYVETIPDARSDAAGHAPKSQPASANDPTGAASQPPRQRNSTDDEKVNRSAGTQVRASQVPTGSTLTTAPPTRQRKQLEEIDSAARAELGKTVAERRFDPLIKRYQVLAEQETDDFARRYAQTRIEQLRSMATLVETVRKMRKLGNQADSKRRKFLADRAGIREMLPPIPRGLDAQGELRASALYPPGSFPCRYRLVDPTGPTERTIGYVEIPPDSGIEIDNFVGRYVGVRASAKRLHAGGVNPVPIYVAGELILLQPATESAPSEQD
jgi:uncharacterized protein YgiM (DUF1202 family)